MQGPCAREERGEEGGIKVYAYFSKPINVDTSCIIMDRAIILKKKMLKMLDMKELALCFELAIKACSVIFIIQTASLSPM